HQAGNGNYTAAADVPQSFNIAQASHAITSGALSGKTFGDADFTISATASSNLPVTFTASGNATVVGNTVHITGAGSATITAHQTSEERRVAADDVPQSFNIAQASQTITFGALS